VTRLRRGYGVAGECTIVEGQPSPVRRSFLAKEARLLISDI